MSFSKHTKKHSYQRKVRTLPCVQEVLCCCDDELLYRAIVNTAPPCVTQRLQSLPKAQKHIKSQIERALQVMKSLPLQHKKADHRLFLPIELFTLDHHISCIDRQIGMRLFYRDDLALVCQALDKATSQSQLHSVFKKRHCALDPWEVSLATKLSFAGLGLAAERYRALAALFWEITSFGFEYDQVVAGQMHEKAHRWAQRQSSLPLSSSYPPSVVNLSISDVYRSQRNRWGLTIPDQFKAQWADGLTLCVDRLNSRAETKVCQRFVKMYCRSSSKKYKYS